MQRSQLRPASSGVNLSGYCREDLSVIIVSDQAKQTVTGRFWGVCKQEKASRSALFTWFGEKRYWWTTCWNKAGILLPISSRLLVIAGMEKSCTGVVSSPGLFFFSAESAFTTARGFVRIPSIALTSSRCKNLAYNKHSFMSVRLWATLNASSMTLFPWTHCSADATLAQGDNET